jgi:hypothetical protein
LRGISAQGTEYCSWWYIYCRIDDSKECL